MPPPRPSRRLPPSRAREGWGAPAARARAVRVAGAVLLACLGVAAVAPRAAAAPGWQRPVAAPVARGFDYAGDPFAAGRHRGVDFAARPGQPVRSACAGRVVFAGIAGSSGPTVSVRCGRWRVAYLPLRAIVIARGARVKRGARLGTAAGSGAHAGLHVGVRREGRRWAYVDPLQFFGSLPPPPVSLGPRRVRPPPTAPRSVPVAERRRLPRARPVARPLPSPAAWPTAPMAEPHLRPHPSPRARPLAPWPATPARPLAPWPAWAGLALVLAGASGTGVALRRRAAGRRAVAAPRVSSSSG